MLSRYITHQPKEVTCRDVFILISLFSLVYARPKVTVTLGFYYNISSVSLCPAGTGRVLERWRMCESHAPALQQLASQY